MMADEPHTVVGFTAGTQFWPVAAFRGRVPDLMLAAPAGDATPCSVVTDARSPEAALRMHGRLPAR